MDCDGVARGQFCRHLEHQRSEQVVKLRKNDQGLKSSGWHNFM